MRSYRAENKRSESGIVAAELNVETETSIELPKGIYLVKSLYNKMNEKVKIINH